jgi:uncharacterized protein YbbK (DUF523 family)
VTELKQPVKQGQPLVRIGISSCLLGEKVRYDGGHKLDLYLRDTLGRCVEYVAICPEIECGFGVPREPMHLDGDPGNPRIVTRETKVDMTDRIVGWARNRAGELEKEDLSGFIFKSRSPSCGVHKVKVVTAKGGEVDLGVGIFARVFIDRFPGVPVEDNDRLQDPAVREKFIEAIFTFAK